MNKVLSRDGTTIAFDRSGEGSPVILVSGALGNRSHPMFRQLAAELAPHFTVFNYDRRGRGESGDTAPYALEREIDDIDAVIAEAGGSAFVYGISSGAVLPSRRRPVSPGSRSWRCTSHRSSSTTAGLHCRRTT